MLFPTPFTLRRSAVSISRRCHSYRRGLLTLAIETSCDDTSVAIVEKTKKAAGDAAKIHFLENITADTRAHRGIHPIIALESHQQHLAHLVQKAIKYLPESKTGDGIKLADGSRRRIPNFISATRGPGMRSNLSVGLDTGKALSVAWQVPMVGVHHMQAHLLTPRLVSCMENANEIETSTEIQRTAPIPTSTPAMAPEFPFLSILVSGGHTILVHSTGLTEHKIIAISEDIAIGEALDKSARDILPAELLQESKSTMYGKTLEKFVFPNGQADFSDYRAPETRGQELPTRQNKWGWYITTPFANTRTLQFSFSSVSSMVGKIIQKKKDSEMSAEERVDLGRETMRVAFEHLASRTVIALEMLRPRGTSDRDQVKTLVVSGGVAANRFLMGVLRSFLDVRGFQDIQVVAPPVQLCTDNAAMIGWAGIEMFEAGWRSDLSGRPVRKWSLDPQAEDGGILGPAGWYQV